MTNKSDDDVNEIDCVEAFDHLYSYLNNEITNPIYLANIEHHLSHCKSCYSRVQMEKEINQRIKISGKSEAPDSLKERLGKLMDDL